MRTKTNTISRSGWSLAVRFVYAWLLQSSAGRAMRTQGDPMGTMGGDKSFFSRLTPNAAQT